MPAQQTGGFSSLSGFNLLDADDLSQWMSNLKQTAYSINRYRRDSDLLDVEELMSTQADYLMLCRDIKGLDSVLETNPDLQNVPLPLDSESMGISFDGVNHFREIEGQEKVDFRHPTLGALKDWCFVKFDTFGKSLTPPEDPLSWYKLSAQSEVSGTWLQPDILSNGCAGLAGININPETGVLEEVVNEYGLSLDLDTENLIGASPYVEAFKAKGLKTESDLQHEQSVYFDAMSAVDRVAANEAEIDSGFSFV